MQTCRKDLSISTISAICYLCEDAGACEYECYLLTFCSMVFTTGSVKVNLTNDCWGAVIICVGSKCGGVCKDAWSPEKSRMLCQNLGCGVVNLQSENLREKREVIVKSLHTTVNTANLNQSLMVMNDEKDMSCTFNPVYVICSGDRKISICVIFIGNDQVG